MNLSHRTLSEVEISLLSKGLKFSPTPTDLGKAQLKADLDVFKRRMRLRWFFRDSESNPLDIKISKFRCKSSWNPPTSDPLLESFLSQLEKEVLSITTDGKYYSLICWDRQHLPFLFLGLFCMLYHPLSHLFYCSFIYCIYPSFLTSGWA